MVKMNSTDEIKKQVEDSTMALVYFGTETCGVCVDLKPKVIEMLKAYPEIKYMEVDAHKSIRVAADHSIFTIPGIIVYAEGKEVIREARHISVGDLENKIKRYYGMLFE